MKKILFVIILLFPLFGYTDTLYLGLFSHHFKQCDVCENGVWNERHDLIGYSNGNNVFAYMKNSYNDDSFYMGKRWMYNINSYIRPYITFGLATGYTDRMMFDIGPFTPTGFTGIEFHTKDEHFGINIATIPGEVIAIGLKFKI